jgi:hypothetical protein
MKRYTFTILGDNRSATTSMWSCFRYHPQISSCILKEMLHRIPMEDDLKDYISLNFSVTSKTKVLLDGSPNLIGFRPKFIDKIRDLPDVKRLCCLYILRSPIERLKSYTHLLMVNYRNRRTDLPYFVGKDMSVDDGAMMHFFVKECSSFWKIRRIEQKIGMDNLLIIKLGELEQNLSNIFNFLEIDDAEIKIPKVNRSLDLAPNIDHLKFKMNMERWVIKNIDSILYVDELDTSRINKRYGI